MVGVCMDALRWFGRHHMVEDEASTYSIVTPITEESYP